MLTKNNKRKIINSGFLCLEKIIELYLYGENKKNISKIENKLSINT